MPTFRMTYRVKKKKGHIILKAASFSDAMSKAEEKLAYRYNGAKKDDIKITSIVDVEKAAA